VGATENGQVTIPQEIRRALGIRPRNEVELVAKDQYALLKRVARPECVAEQIAAYRGAADAGMSTEKTPNLTRRGTSSHDLWINDVAYAEISIGFRRRFHRMTHVFVSERTSG
jgi:AbrB family looped-hinge helix DNA binding protein